MTSLTRLGWAVGASALLACAAPGQPLPKLRMRLVFPHLVIQRPIWMEDAPDDSGRVFVVEQAGRIVAFPRGSDGGAAREFLNITDRRPLVANTQGLLGFAFHPRYRANGKFYVFYSQENPRRNVVSEFHVDPSDPNRADPASERVLLTIPHPFDNNHGGQLGFGPDGYFYLTSGDGGGPGDPYNNGQNVASLLGKVLRLDVDHPTRTLPYGIPPDNPFASEGNGVRHEIWAYGLRNVWRMSWDRLTGELWGADVGADKWEEVDLLVKGGNYGWCVREGFHHFKPGPPGARYLEPVLEYAHNPLLAKESRFPNHAFGNCIIGGYVYRGSRFPALQGVYLYADYTLGTIWGLRYQHGKVTADAALLEQPKNIASFAQDAQGELYALAFDDHIYALEAVEANVTAAPGPRPPERVAATP